LPDSKSGRVFFFLRTHDDAMFPGLATMLVRVYDLRTFLSVGTLAVPNISGWPTAVVRWGPDGFAFRTSTNKVYLLQTSLIAPPIQPPPVPVPRLTPPTYTLRGQVSNPSGPPLSVTLRLSGGLTATTTTNSDGSFAFTGLPFCTDFTVTPDPLEAYTFSPTSVTITAANQNNPNQSTAFFNAVAKTVRFAQSTVTVGESAGNAKISVIRTGDVSAPATVKYQTVDGTASERSDYTAAIGTLRFGANEGSKQITVFITDDVRTEPNETITVNLSDATGGLLGTLTTQTISITDNDPTNGSSNPADNPEFFVRQHYLDFLNREADAAGLAFWVNQITSCGSDSQCVEIKRINVSAAFFLSIEFQETGYLAYCAHKSAYGDTTSPNVAGTVPIMRLKEFLTDAQRIGQGVQVGIGNWQQQLEANKNAHALEFVQRQRFVDAYPSTMSAQEFVSKLDQNSGGVLSASEKVQLVGSLGSTPAAAANRAVVLRALADNAALRRAELNRAFVLMQYYGYLRRNPDDTPNSDFSGWSFWLSKLNEFNGNFVQAEMVKAFISSSEYRQRFGQ
jgi:hypothetical protein